MKTALSATLLLFLLTFFSSCKKDSPAIITPPVVLTKTQLLTQHVWELNKMLLQDNSTQTSFQRGGINTTGLPWGNATWAYNANGTGSYLDYTGTTYLLTWAFNPADSTQITVVGSYSPPITFNFYYVQLTDSSFNYSQTFVSGGVTSLQSMELIPVP